MGESLKDKTAKGLFWGLLNNGTNQILNAAFGILLARLLVPEDYGIMAMLTIFTAIAGNLQSSGFSTALINMKNATQRDYNAVFWFNVLTSIAIYIILAFCAPLIADYYHQPCLVVLSRIVFFSFVIGSFGIVPNAYMTKHLMVREMAIVSFVSMVISGIAGVAFAFMGMGYWSFAWQQIIQIFLFNIGRYYYISWRPDWKIDFSPIRRMFSFSIKILITMIINTLNANVLVLFIGRMFTTHSLGNYSQGNKWSTMAYQMISGMLQQVAQPVFATAADEDERELRIFRKMIRFSSFLAFPALFGLALISKEFVLILVGAKWAGSILMMQILCISGAFFPLYAIYQNLVVGKGRSDMYMWCNILQVVFQTALIFALYRFGILMMVIGYAIFNIVWILPWHYFAHRIIGITLWQVVSDILPFLLASAGVMVVTYIITMPISALWLLLLIRIPMAAALYYAVMKMARVEILDECTQFILKKFRK